MTDVYRALNYDQLWNKKIYHKNNTGPSEIRSKTVWRDRANSTFPFPIYPWSEIVKM